MKKTILLMTMLIFLSSFVYSADLTVDDELYYSFDNANLSGSDPLDLTPNGNDGTNDGATTGVGGLINEAFSFDGSNDKITIPNGILSNSISFSLSFWVKFDSISSERAVFRFDNDLYFESFLDLLGGANEYDFALHNGVDWFLVTDSSPSTVDWVHYVFTFNISTKVMILYKNGFSIDTNTLTGTTDTGPVPDGNKISDGSNDLDGLMDEFSIWNGRVLTPNEVLKLYNENTGLQFPFPSPDVRFHRVHIVNNWTGGNLVGVNVSLNNSLWNLTQADGVAYFSNLSGSFSYNATFPQYFNVSGVALENQTVNNNMFQSQINISVTELFTGNPVNNISIYVNGLLVINTTNNWGLIYPNVSDYNVTQVIDNGGDDTFHITNISFSVLVFDNFTHTVRVHQHFLNVTAHNKLSGDTITDFTVNITSLNITDMRSNTTTTGLAIFPVIHNTYTVTIDAEGFAFFNNTINVTITADTLINFSLFTTNSLNITFKDILTNTIMNETNITIQFIGTTAQTNITSTGLLYVDLFTPDTYTLIYDAEGYRQGKYIISIANRSVTHLTLYMQLTNDTQLILLEVQDKFGTVINGAIVTVQRWSDDAWATDQIVQTDFQGRSEAYYILSTVFYNHVIQFNDIIYFGAINDDDNKKIIYAEDVTDGLKFTIDILGEAQLPSYQDTFTPTYTLTYINTSNTTGFFRFFWSSDGNQFDGKLKVVKGGSNSLICSNSTTTATGTLFCFVNQSTGRSYYTATGSLNGFVKDAITKLIGQRTVPDFGNTGYIMAFFGVVVGVFIFIGTPLIGLWFGAVIFIVFGLMGLIFKDANIGIYMILLAITYLVAGIKSKSGVES